MTLTPREQEIIAGLRQGYSIFEVEQRLGLPRNSLRAQVRALHEKVKMKSNEASQPTTSTPDTDVSDIKSTLERSGYTLAKLDDGSLYITRYTVPPKVRKPVVPPDLGTQAAIDRASKQAAVVEVEPASEEAPAQASTPAEDPWRRVVFVFPWGGCVVLNAVVAAYTERDCLVIQLSKGGFTRSPAHPRAAQVCEQITAAMLELPHSKRIDAKI